MNRLSAAKRDQLIALVIGTLGIVALVWYFLILPLRAKLRDNDRKLVETRGQVEVARRNMRMLDQFEADLKASRRKLQQKEEQMAAGDAYRWILRVFDELETAHRVNVFNLEAPRMEACNIPPPVPYKAAVFSVSGAGHYHDFGVFLADLENRFPYMRLRELELRPARFVDTGSEDREKLSFRMELSTLAKPAPEAQ